MKNNNNQPLQRAIDQIGNAIDKAIVVAVDGEVPDVLLARLAEARGGVVRADLITHVIDIANDQERIYADEVWPLASKPPKSLELPKLKKQPKPSTNSKGHKLRPGIKKKMRKPLDYKCPTCEAEPDTACFKFSSLGKSGHVTDERHENPNTTHAARQALSKAFNDRVRQQYDREHFESGS